jgi:hypothetical protein
MNFMHETVPSNLVNHKFRSEPFALSYSGSHSTSKQFAKPRIYCNKQILAKMVD